MKQEQTLMGKNEFYFLDLGNKTLEGLRSLIDTTKRN